MKKSEKGKNSLGEEREKSTGPKKEYYTAKKSRRSLVKATGTPLHAGVQMKSPPNKKFSCIKNEVSFLFIQVPA